MDHDRPVELRRKVRFVGRSQIAAPFELTLQSALGMSFLQHLRGFVVGYSRKWDIDFFELGDVSSDGLQVGATPFETALH